MLSFAIKKYQNYGDLKICHVWLQKRVTQNATGYWHVKQETVGLLEP